MKKFMLLLTLVVSFSLGLYAKDYHSKWNIPTGSYTCTTVSFNDKKWNVIHYIPKKERSQIGIVLDQKEIVDASGTVFKFYKTNSEGTNVFISEDNSTGIFLPSDSKEGQEYGIGAAYENKGRLVRMYMKCKKDH